MIRVLSLIFISGILASCAITPSPSTDSDNNTSVATTISGTITEIDNGCAYDQICSFKVNDIWVEALRGGLQRPDLPEETKGQIIGELPFDNSSLNSTVEVYGLQTSPNNLTIYGDTSYYIKKTN